MCLCVHVHVRMCVHECDCTCAYVCICMHIVIGATYTNVILCTGNAGWEAILSFKL